MKTSLRVYVVVNDCNSVIPISHRYRDDSPIKLFVVFDDEFEINGSWFFFPVPENFYCDQKKKKNDIRNILFIKTPRKRQASISSTATTRTFSSAKNIISRRYSSTVFPDRRANAIVSTKFDAAR